LECPFDWEFFAAEEIDDISGIAVLPKAQDYVGVGPMEGLKTCRDYSA
jgi:hypothetical protein